MIKNILFVITCLMISLVSVGIIYAGGTPEIQVINIVSLKSEMVTKGSFILGCGMVDEEEYLFTFYRVNGGYKRLIIPMDSCTIYEDSEKPYIRIYRPYSWSTKWHTYDVHVPTGTIIKKFKLE